MKRVGLYTRRATQVDLSILQAEFETLKNSACVDNKTAITNYIDNGFSGVRFNRPALQQMLKDCKKGKLDAVVISMPCRLSRDISMFRKICKTLNRYGVALFIGDNTKEYEYNSIFDNVERRLANGA